MKTSIDQQTELLKLIVQKMDIRTEEDDNDENCVETQNGDANTRTQLLNSNIKNTRLRNMVIKQFASKNVSNDNQR
jgi:hypothetical protein